MSKTQPALRLTTIAPTWSAPSNVVALTTTRIGGFSQGACASLNLAGHVDDNQTHVLQNRQRLEDFLRLPAQPRWLRQTHSTNILMQDQKGDHGNCDADGSVSFVSGVVCAVMTADCMPLLLCNRAGTKVGAVHAGWKGLADGIIERAIQVFDEPPEQIIAWAGPTISAKHFEIGDEVRQQLGGKKLAYRPSASEGKWMADLYILAEERLAKMGVSNYQYSALCTYADAAKFYSHRRDGQGGRMVSLIYLTQ